MKHFKNLIMVKYPHDLVWKTIRDRLPELVPWLDNVDKVTVEERSEQDNGDIKLTNLWQAKVKIPPGLKSVINPEMLSWIDKAEWNESSKQCHWQIEPNFFHERITCSGTASYEPAMGGRGTKITFEGDIKIDAHQFHGVPAALESTIESGIESMVTSLIPRNFRKMTEALPNIIEKDTS